MSEHIQTKFSRINRDINGIPVIEMVPEVEGTVFNIDPCWMAAEGKVMVLLEVDRTIESNTAGIKVGDKFIHVRCS